MDGCNRDIVLLKEELEETKKQLRICQPFRSKFEDERALNNCTKKSLEENLELFIKVSTDYDTCLVKMQEMEQRIISLIKENNSLRENLVFRQSSAERRRNY